MLKQIYRKGKTKVRKVDRSRAEEGRLRRQGGGKVKEAGRREG